MCPVVSDTVAAHISAVQDQLRVGCVTRNIVLPVERLLFLLKPCYRGRRGLEYRDLNKAINTLHINRLVLYKTLIE
jgi:hypothetical protein